MEIVCVVEKHFAFHDWGS